jgi:hypothetical protein
MQKTQRLAPSGTEDAIARIVRQQAALSNATARSAMAQDDETIVRSIPTLDP